MKNRRTKAELREMRRTALLAYQKQRWRNAMATPGVFDCVLVLDHLKAGFNVAKIFRSAQAMGAHELHLIDIGPFDPSPAKGALKHVPARFYDRFDESYQELKGRGYTLFTLEPDTDNNLMQMALPQKSAFILGHEEYGISFERADYPDIQPVRIPHYGPVQSLNVAVAASIVLYEYARHHHTDALEHRGANSPQRTHGGPPTLFEEGD